MTGVIKKEKPNLKMEQITLPFTAPEDGFVCGICQCTSTGRCYIIYENTGIIPNILDGYQYGSGASNGFIVRWFLLPKGVTMTKTGSSNNIKGENYRFVSFN